MGKSPSNRSRAGVGGSLRLAGSCSFSAEISPEESTNLNINNLAKVTSRKKRKYRGAFKILS